MKNAKTPVELEIPERIEWVWRRNPNTRMLVAECPRLGQVAEGDDIESLIQAIVGVVDDLVRYLIQEGELESYLREHGLSLTGRVPPRVDASARYMLPFALAEHIQATG